MNENQTNKEDSRGISWSGIIALVLAFFGVVLSFWGALVTTISQAQIPKAPLWPLPGLVLIDWVLFTLIGFIIAYLCFRRASTKWLRLAWIFTGMLIPLIIFGAFSIGMAVLIVFLLFMVSTIIFAIRQSGKLLESFGLLMLGSICNLGILLVILTLFNQSY